MNGVVRISLPNFLAVGIMAVVFVFVVNWALRAMSSGRWSL
jgi:hypothetical protein